MSNENWRIELFQITLMYSNAVREYLGMHRNCGVREAGYGFPLPKGYRDTEC